MNLIKKLVELENEASAFGFQWEDAEQIMQQIQSECLEVNEHLQAKTSLNEASLQEEIGDLLHAVFSLCIFCKLDPEQTLQNTLEKFEKRMGLVKIIAKEKGLSTLHHQSFEQLMAIWNLAKERIANK